jgi:hypothetical protein
MGLPIFIGIMGFIGIIAGSIVIYRHREDIFAKPRSV